MATELRKLSTAARQAVQTQDWHKVDTFASLILAADEQSAEGYFLTGLVEKARRRPRKAASAFERALSLDSGRYDAAIELANQYSIARRNGDAAQLLGDYEKFLNNSPRYLDLAGTIYTDIGMAAKAWPLYLLANKLQPNIDLFQANLAACAVFLGKIEEAKSTYQGLLKRYPNHQRNHYQLSRLGRAKDSAHIDQMLDILHSVPLSADKNIFLYYALGKEYEDLGQWDDAFKYYQLAGDAVSSVADYDLGRDIELIDTVIDVCNKDWLAPRGASSADDTTGKTPIFIVGLPRTGTTLTERILSSHSKVSSLGETQFMQMVLRRESGVATTEAVNSKIIRAAAERDIDLVADGYMDAINYRLGSEPMFIDKLPLNILYLGFVAKAYPDAKIVHLRRHPMDACFSMYKQVFTWAYKFSYTLEGLGQYYVAYDRLSQHWHKVLGDRLVEVQYESLVTDQEQQTRALLDSLGLEFEQACLDFDKNPTASATASSVQVRQKIHTGSVEKWRHFEQHLQPLLQHLENSGIRLD